MNDFNGKARLRRAGPWIVFAVIAAFGLGYALRGGGRESREGQYHNHASQEQVQASAWTCSMHPRIQQPGPGQCPLCGMDLIPVSGGYRDDALGPRALKLSATAKKLAAIEVAPVERKFVPSEIRMVGKVDYDETRISTITAWVPGRIDRLFVDYTGIPIRKGDHMASLYSPKLLSAQEELLQALKAKKDVQKSGLSRSRETARQTIDSVREKLRLLGLTKEQIGEIEKRGVAEEHTTIHAPMSGVVIHKNALEGMYVETGTKIYTIADLSHVWVKLDAYESDLASLRQDQAVMFQTKVYPGRDFHGRIAFIDPVLDEKTRTVGVRVNVPNPDGKLKPGMFVRATVLSAPASDMAPLVIPASAPLITGKRAVVYVADPDEEGVYEGREVMLGPRAGEHYLVEEGLAAGEAVVVNGNFKIDSAIQIQARPSMMSPEGGVQVGGHHDHSAELAETPGEVVTERPEVFDVPNAFKIRIDGVLLAYFDLHKALSRDDFKAVDSRANTLLKAIEKVEPGLLEGPAHHVWMMILADLQESVGKITGADDISQTRRAFSPLSNSLHEAATRFGTSGKMPIYRIHCPMALDGAGAYWLQNNPETENPYYGEAMFRCSDSTETVVAGPVKADGKGHGHD